MSDDDAAMKPASTTRDNSANKTTTDDDGDGDGYTVGPRARKVMRKGKRETGRGELGKASGHTIHNMSWQLPSLRGDHRGRGWGPKRGIVPLKQFSQ